MFFLTVPDKKLILSIFPKCGCKTTRSIVLNENLKSEMNQNKKGNIWLDTKKNQITSESDLDRLLTQDYKIYLIVRNPYKRLVSAYCSKFLLPDGNEKRLGDVLKILNFYGKDKETGISFEEFVNHILDQNPEDLNPHWRPCFILAKEVLDKKFNPKNSYKQNIQIIKLEQIDKLNKVLDEIGCENNFTNSRVSSRPKKNLERYIGNLNRAEISNLINLKNEVPNYANFYTPELRSKVKKYYEKDFTTFSYLKK